MNLNQLYLLDQEDKNNHTTGKPPKIIENQLESMDQKSAIEVLNWIVNNYLSENENGVAIAIANGLIAESDLIKLNLFLRGKLKYDFLPQDIRDSHSINEVVNDNLDSIFDSFSIRNGISKNFIINFFYEFQDNFDSMASFLDKISEEFGSLKRAISLRKPILERLQNELGYSEGEAENIINELIKVDYNTEKLADNLKLAISNEKVQFSAWIHTRFLNGHCISVLSKVCIILGGEYPEKKSEETEIRDLARKAYKKISQTKKVIGDISKFDNLRFWMISNRVLANLFECRTFEEVRQPNSSWRFPIK